MWGGLAFVLCRAVVEIGLVGRLGAAIIGWGGRGGTATPVFHDRRYPGHDRSHTTDTTRTRPKCSQTSDVTRCSCLGTVGYGPCTQLSRYDCSGVCVPGVVVLGEITQVRQLQGSHVDLYPAGVVHTRRAEAGLAGGNICVVQWLLLQGVKGVITRV